MKNIKIFCSNKVQFYGNSAQSMFAHVLNSKVVVSKTTFKHPNFFRV